MTQRDQIKNNLGSGCKTCPAKFVFLISRLRKWALASLAGQPRSGWMSSALLLAATLIPWFYSTLPTVASEYTVEGKIRYEIYNLSGGNSVLQEDDFTASVKDCNWHIKKIPRHYTSQGKDEPLGDYGTISSDGTNFYEVLSFNQGTNVYGRIGSGATPYCLTDPKTLVLWYAFASGCHFTKQQDQFLNNPFTMVSQADYAKDYRVRARWQLSEFAPFLPNHIAFDAKTRFELGEKLRADSSWAYTNAIYSAKEVTKVGELELPKLISVDYFAPNPTNSRSLFRFGSIIVEATSFNRSAQEVAYRPGDLKFHTVSDMRTIASNTPFGVASLNKTGWPDLQDSEAKAKSLAVSYQEAAKAKVARSPRPFLIMLLLSAPILFFILWKSSHQIKTEA